MRQSENEDFSWISLSSDNDNLGVFQEFILNQAKVMSASPQILLKLELVLEEVLLNIMNYAYPNETPGIITLGFRVSGENMIVIRIIDEGKAFDPSAKPDPDTSLAVEDRKIGGLGILLVRQMSEAVSYERKDGLNILDVCFNLEPKQ